MPGKLTPFQRLQGENSQTVDKMTVEELRGIIRAECVAAIEEWHIQQQSKKK